MLFLIGCLGPDDGAAAGMGAPDHRDTPGYRLCQFLFVSFVDAAVAGARIDESFRSGLQGGPNHGPIGAGGAVEDVDLRQGSQGVHRKGLLPFPVKGPVIPLYLTVVHMT